MKVSFEQRDIHRTAAECIISFVSQDALRSDISQIARKIRATVTAAETGEFTGKEGELTVVYTGRGSRLRRYILAGLGETKRLTPERYRRAAGNAARKARSMKVSSLAFMMPPIPRAFDEIAKAIVEGALLGLYRYNKYISKEEEAPRDIESIAICSPARSVLRKGTRVAEQASMICEATAFARDLGNAPGNEIYPESLAEAAKASSARGGFQATILDEHDIKNLGMGGVLGVSQGSVHPPRFIVLEYRHSRKRPVVLIGKGVTFDSGGISIKPSAGMAEMKMDMSGAAAVIGTFDAVSRLKLPVHIVGLIPAVENMPSGSSIRPGDILRHHNGKTSEVDNTYAEGRLILADALSYAEKFKPSAVIDLATLTGAVVVALGHYATGMMGNDATLMRRLREAGDATYERVWELPMYDEYEKLIKSDIADVKNVGGRWAGAITGAMFLRKFIGSYRWVHLDIAGTAMQEEAGSYTVKGASGVGVRLLTEFLRRWK